MPRSLSARLAAAYTPASDAPDLPPPVTVTHQGATTTVTLVGEIGRVWQSALYAEVRDALERGQRTIRVDCARVGRIHGAPFSVLVAGTRRAREQGAALVLARPSESVVWQLEATKLAEQGFLTVEP
jgi:anti-anti-sigma factor